MSDRVADALPQPVWAARPDGSVTYVNHAWEELWGVTLADIPGYNVLTDPQLAANGVTAMLRRAFAGERVEIPPVGYVPDRGAFQGRQPRLLRSGRPRGHGGHGGAGGTHW